MRRIGPQGPRWSDVLPPAQAQRFAALRALAEPRRIAELDERLRELEKKVRDARTEDKR